MVMQLWHFLVQTHTINKQIHTAMGGTGGADRTMVMQLWHETAKIKVSSGSA